MDIVLSFRRWIARYGRWIATVGWFFLIDGFWSRDYVRDLLGLAIFGLATWGMLLDADQPGTPRAFQRRNLTFLMWSSVVIAVGVAALALWVQFAPEG